MAFTTVAAKDVAQDKCNFPYGTWENGLYEAIPDQAV